MPAHRFVPLRVPVTICLDGERVAAEAGEPVAFSLIAADKLVLARSPKLHRPRGPSCLRGGCDGCLVRLDGEPNVMACLREAREGADARTQNVLGTRTVDLLRVTDWFFPDGIDHHHLLAGIPGVSSVMQVFARRVAGLGTLPDRPVPPRPGRRSRVDALVIGAGPAGLAAASALARRGRSVTLVDDATQPGGSLRAMGAGAVASLLDGCPLGETRLLLRSVAAGVFGRSCLVVSPEGAELFEPDLLVLATGAHDGQWLFENNDLPGVWSARAAALLAASGIAVGKRVAVAGRGPFADALRRLLDGQAELFEIDLASLLKAEGSSRVGGVIVRDGDGERRVRCDAIAVEAPPSPSFELAEQAGASVRWHERRGFAPQAAEVVPGVWCVGEARGLPFDLERLVEDGRRVAGA